MPLPLHSRDRAQRESPELINTDGAALATVGVYGAQARPVRPARDDEKARGPRVCLGIVGAPHGVRGAVRIKTFTDEPAAIARYGALEDESGERRFTLRVTGSAKGDGMVIATLSGVTDRDRAETLRGLRLYAPRAALPPTEEDEFYHTDLVGLAAVLEDGTEIGRVVAVHDFGACDVIEIAQDKGRPVVVPFTRAAVPVVDIAGGRVVLDPPAGLLDLPRIKTERVAV
jgi:16S rRNA processing protein RimM